MPKHTSVSAKLSANTAGPCSYVTCALDALKRAHCCQNAQMSFLVAFFPPVPFLFPFLYCPVPWHPGLESLDLKLWNQQTADRTTLPAACGWSVGPGPAVQTGDSAPESHTVPGSLCLLHGNICAGCSRGMPDSREKALNTGFKLLKK